MAKLGILFNIEELGGGLYGYEAYKGFFETMDTRKIPGAVLYDGDMRATLSGGQNAYCIALESNDEKVLADIEKKFTLSTARGLAPAGERFLKGERAESEPLAPAAQVGPNGELLNCKTNWVLEAWQAVRQKSDRVKLLTAKDLNQRQKVYIRNQFILSGVGLLMLVVSALIFGGRELGWCPGLIFYSMLIVGMYLLVIRFIPFGGALKEPFEKTLLRLRNQTSWFHSIPCPDCQKSSLVNVGYVEFNCQKYGEGNRHRSGLSYNPPDFLVNGAGCVTCKETNDVKNRPAVFTCEHCGKEVVIENIPS